VLTWWCRIWWWYERKKFKCGRKTKVWVARNWMQYCRWQWGLCWKRLGGCMWPTQNNSWRLTRWGPCWALYFVLIWDYVNSGDDLEMVVSSNDFWWVPLREHLITFNETHILDDDDARVVRVKKKISFHKEAKWCWFWRFYF